MKLLKYSILSFLLLIIFCFQAPSEERKKPLSIKELTDPNSPSYVPCPYPKTREEIIADFKYYTENFCGKKDGYKESFIHVYESNTDKISMNIFKPQAEYKIGEIFKLENRIPGFADDYIWLMMIMKQNGQIAMRVALMASGLVIGSGTIGEQDLAAASPEECLKYIRLMKVLTGEDIKNILSQSLGCTISNNEIKEMKRVVYPASIGEYLCPLWEIKLTKGTIYYYSEVRDMIYSIDKKIPWKKNKDGFRPAKMTLVPHWDYLPDMIDDELIILKKIPRK
ncbi:MAG: hypothetical protein MUF15_03815 [Acidobacteria bacterium]|jgi:hypothetical protein|nr:hypothetical protein [Acidobacteriota bacterium]